MFKLTEEQTSHLNTFIYGEVHNYKIISLSYLSYFDSLNLRYLKLEIEFINFSKQNDEN